VGDWNEKTEVMMVGIVEMVGWGRWAGLGKYLVGLGSSN